MAPSNRMEGEGTWDNCANASNSPAGSGHRYGDTAYRVTAAAATNATLVLSARNRAARPGASATSSARSPSTAANSSAPMTRRLTSTPTPAPKSANAPAVPRRNARSAKHRHTMKSAANGTSLVLKKECA